MLTLGPILAMVTEPILKPYITALIVRSTVYGLYFTSLVHCLRWLLFKDEERKLRDNIDWRLVSISVFIFFFITTALGVTSQITLDLVQGDYQSAKLAIAKVRPCIRSLSVSYSFNPLFLFTRPTSRTPQR